MNTATENHRFFLLAYWLFTAALLVFLALYAFRPIADPDFWWHLKSGEVMWLNKGLLHHDPFTYTADSTVTLREKLILQGYWLWQLPAYGLYRLAQFNGIFVLNFATLLAMAGVVGWQLRQRGVSLIVAAPLLTLTFVLLSYIYPMERPQVVSFLCAAILLSLLSRVQEGEKLGWPLPLTMLLWANMHGAFIVGAFLITLFAAGALFQYRNERNTLRHIILWTALALLASLLNPNGIGTYHAAIKFYNAPLMSAVREYQSTLTVFNEGDSHYAILWLLIGLYGVGKLLSRRFYWPEIFIALFLAWFSVVHVRNVAFFSLALLPATGADLHHWLNRLSNNSEKTHLWRVLLALAVLGSVAGLGIRGGELKQEKALQGVVSSWFPTAAVDFIERSSLRGNMLNNYDFGGYLLWRFYPERKVFIDGRGMKPEIYEDWKAISSASLDDGSAGKKEYEELLDQYEIDFVVQPLSLLFSGRITPLVKFLLNKPDWSPVYVDAQSYVLVRASEKNRQVIDRFAFDKKQFVEKIIAYLQYQTYAQPDNVLPRVALAEMLIFFGDYDQAQRQIDTIRRLQPKNPEIPKLVNQLNILKG
ncbi:MAG: tetratricopeptide repeat protein [Desulfuromonadales bacterium]|nr:tetratricopeptide repeat protein [Desulfuromonadales bacterium]